MNPWKPNRSEWRTFIVMMPVFDVIINTLLFGKRFFQEPQVMVGSFMVILVIGFISWYFHIATMHLLRIQYPALPPSVKRVLLLAVLHLSLVFASRVVMFYGYDAVHLFGYQINKSDVGQSLLAGIGLTLVAS